MAGTEANKPERDREATRISLYITTEGNAESIMRVVHGDFGLARTHVEKFAEHLQQLLANASQCPFYEH